MDTGVSHCCVGLRDQSMPAGLRAVNRRGWWIDGGGCVFDLNSGSIT